MLLAIVLGFIFWSPLEYGIHRFLGHQLKFKNKFRKEHQKHHHVKDYFAGTIDKLLGALPAMAIIFVTGLFFVNWKMSLLFSIAFLVSYMIYEYIHLTLHIKAPKTRMGRLLRMHHFYHHFSNEHVNHGVTTRFWDRVFGTYVPVEVVEVPEKFKMIWLTDDNLDYKIVPETKYT
jgi:sterol desaturase/sphingolipid hydroxylase (fatty acid hydroxylase superfamily)